jgi:hypothetical protein
MDFSKIVEQIDFKTIFEQNKYIFLMMGVIVVATIFYNLSKMRKMKDSNREFLTNHPDAAKVYLTTRAFITSEAVSVYTVDGEAPQNFSERGKTGFYAIPGERIVEARYAYQRPGVFYKTVTTTYGPVKKELILEAKKNYKLGFDRKAESFTLAEI